MDKEIERECAEFRLSVVGIDEEFAKLTHHLKQLY